MPALLRNNPRYASALGTGTNTAAFATALQRGGYATDPNYAAKLVAVAAIPKVRRRAAVNERTSRVMRSLDG